MQIVTIMKSVWFLILLEIKQFYFVIILKVSSCFLQPILYEVDADNVFVCNGYFISKLIFFT